MTETEEITGSLCWPEQYPGERAAYEKWSARMDKEHPGRKVQCCSWNTDYWPCHHCQVCHRFVSGITGIIYPEIGIAAVYGTCKDHGKQYVDMTHWIWEHFEGDEVDE